MNIRVLLVDDHAVLRDGLRVILEREPDITVVGEAGDGLEAVRLAGELLPDVVVMDVAMPGMSGVEATRRIKKEQPSSQVLVLTQYEHREYILPIMRAGADGYILKRSAGTELVKAVRAVHAGESVLHPVAARALIEAFVGSERREAGTDNPDQLTDREREVLILIAQGYTNQQIATTLHISPKTVDVHRTNIMSKLDLHSRTDLIKYAIRKGLVHLDMDDR